MINILFAARPDQWPIYEAHLRDAFDGLGTPYHLATDLAPDVVDYIVYAPDSHVTDFRPYTRLRAVLNLWAGVETVVGNDTLQVPLARMVDVDGLTQGMVEWVTGHTLRHHLGLDQDIHNGGKWTRHVPPLSKDRPVTILGMGALGCACAQALVSLGFPVTGWSRTAKTIENVRSLYGDDGLKQALSGAQIVILLLPKTPKTENILNAQTIDLLADGAFIINPGRGPLIDDDALLAALDRGKVAHATLDVFRVEPLPADHPYWNNPRVTVTPHIASETRPDSAARAVAANIQRDLSGQPMIHTVDRSSGY